MKPLYPLQGLHSVILCLISVLFFISPFGAPTAHSQSQEADLNLREIEVTLEHVLKNVERVERLFANLSGNLAVSGSMLEIRMTINDLTVTGQELNRLFTVWFDNSLSDRGVTRREILAVLDQLGTDASTLQRLLQPTGIARIQDVNLRDVHFALNNVVAGVERLKRMIAPGLNDTPETDAITLDQITTLYRSIVASVDKAQTISYSIDRSTVANNEHIREIAGLLKSAANESQTFSRMLRAYGASLGEKENIIRKMLQISNEIWSELERLLNALTPSDRANSNTTTASVDYPSFNRALNHIMTELYHLERGLKALMSSGPVADPFAEPEETESLSPLQRFDLNGNCVIDNAEILFALELWISKQIDRALFMDVVDAWTAGEEVCITADPIGRVEPGSVELKTKASAAGIAFDVIGQAIASAEIEIYNINGVHIKTEISTSNRLVWNLRSELGERVANGIYIYVATFKTLDGNSIRTAVRKIAVVR